VWHYPVGAVVAVYLVWGVVATAMSATALWGWHSGAVAAVLYCIALWCCLSAWRRAPSIWLRLGIAVAIGLVVCAVTDYSGLPLLFMVVVIAPLRMPLGHAVALSLSATCGFVALSLPRGTPTAEAMGIGSGQASMFLIAALANQIGVTRRQAVAMVRARSDEAVLAERQRLAREIHDVLAHSLSAQIVHLEGTRLLLQQENRHTQVLERVAEAGELARRGLREARRAVAALRGDRTSLIAQLAELAAEFRAVTGDPCTLDIDDDVACDSSTAAPTVLRTAQEALSNVRRHAPGAAVTITLHRNGKWLELGVHDTGPPGRDTPFAESGYGLVGMRERAELLGGHLDAGPEGTGFRVRLRVPA
jgi:signal transduction histidine kinase